MVGPAASDVESATDNGTCDDTCGAALAASSAVPGVVSASVNCCLPDRRASTVANPATTAAATSPSAPRPAGTVTGKATWSAT
ncbi:unannotated protein [freshwater metagenome]|uniref:Unannotated protein n=1 Tax=freshwater metagenome TaxID=449393 RepID=A0A6J6EMW9_9ZZZZ